MSEIETGENDPMQHSLTQGPITKNILLFALPLGVTGIWLSVPIGWALADAIGIGYYLKKSACKNDEAMVR